ncbi:hypothetical protein JYT16_00095 [Gemmatimonas aurantiaca]|nr:hypothetical protein [Gemmatimonas aurantiaca]
MPKTSQLLISVCLLALLFCSTGRAQDRIPNFDARIVGSGVFSPDPLNGNYAIVKTGTLVTLILSAQTETFWEMATFPFNLYSPGGDVTTIMHMGTPTFTEAWGIDVFTLGGPQASYISWDGSLPDSFFIGGAAFGNDGESAGFDSPIPVDVFMFSFIVPEGQSGTICIDSGFIPPSLSWYTTPGGPPQWGASVGVYPNGGFCFTVTDEYLDLCDLAGDADHSGNLTIGDVVTVISRIFSGGQHPYSCREMDANGDGMTTIADAVYSIGYHFLFGPAPICGPAGMECGG